MYTIYDRIAKRKRKGTWEGIFICLCVWLCFMFLLNVYSTLKKKRVPYAMIIKYYVFQRKESKWLARNKKLAVRWAGTRCWTWAPRTASLQGVVLTEAWGRETEADVSHHKLSYWGRSENEATCELDICGIRGQRSPQTSNDQEESPHKIPACGRWEVGGTGDTQTKTPRKETPHTRCQTQNMVFKLNLDKLGIRINKDSKILQSTE